MNLESLESTIASHIGSLFHSKACPLPFFVGTLILLHFHFSSFHRQGPRNHTISGSSTLHTLLSESLHMCTHYCYHFCFGNAYASTIDFQYRLINTHSCQVCIRSKHPTLILNNISYLGKSSVSTLNANCNR